MLFSLLRTSSDLSGAVNVDHNSTHRRLIGSFLIIWVDWFGAILVEVNSLFACRIIRFLAAEGVRTLRLQRKEIRGTLFLRSVLIRHSWLHDLLQALAFVRKLIHHSILLLKSILKVINHALLYFLKLLDSMFVSLADERVLISLLLVRLRHWSVVRILIDLLSYPLRIIDIIAVRGAGHLHLLVLISGLEALICHLWWLSL